MAKKGNIFKTRKEIEKDLTKSLFSSVAVAASSLAAAAGHTAVYKKVTNENLRRFLGVGTAATGVALSAAAKNEYVVAVGHGITAAGTMKAVLDFAPSTGAFRAAMGLKGIEDNAISDSELEAMALRAAQENANAFARYEEKLSGDENEQSYEVRNVTKNNGISKLL